MKNCYTRRAGDTDSQNEPGRVGGYPRHGKRYRIPGDARVRAGKIKRSRRAALSRILMGHVNNRPCADSRKGRWSSSSKPVPCSFYERQGADVVRVQLTRRAWASRSFFSTARCDAPAVSGGSPVRLAIRAVVFRSSLRASDARPSALEGQDGGEPSCIRVRTDPDRANAPQDC